MFFKRPLLAMMGEWRLSEMALRSCSSSVNTCGSSRWHPVCVCVHMCAYICVHRQVLLLLPCSNSAHSRPSISHMLAKSQGEDMVALSSALSFTPGEECNSGRCWPLLALVSSVPTLLWTVFINECFYSRWQMFELIQMHDALQRCGRAWPHSSEFL